jgi:hypothetical protein
MGLTLRQITDQLAEEADVDEDELYEAIKEQME